MTYTMRPFVEPYDSMSEQAWLDLIDLADFEAAEADLDRRNQPLALLGQTCDHIDCSRPAAYATFDGTYCKEHA